MKKKAAMLPYVIEDDIYFLFMKPSDPNYGGSRFQIAKGHVDEGEKTLHAAAREAKEELGIKYSNINKIYALKDFIVKGMADDYILSVFLAELNNRSIGAHDRESKEVKFMTYKEFKIIGRRKHSSIVKLADIKLRKLIK